MILYKENSNETLKNIRNNKLVKQDYTMQGIIEKYILFLYTEN